MFRILAACLLFVGTASAAPNVVLLSVDTLRADRLGAYGYDRPTSPNLDAFAKEALLFEAAICEVPLTSPSMGAMLSGRYPRTTGTTRNGLAMPGDVPLVTEQFQAAGYHTFGVLSNWTLKDKLSGLGRGFDVYDDAFTKRRWGFLKSERDGDEVTALALKYLEERPKDKPFFAWIHYSDPHAPYKKHKGLNPSGKRAWGLDRREKIKVRYDSEVAFVDREIGKLLAALPVDTTVLFVADHGESLFEHDYLGHGRRIYQNNLHIPLLIRGAGVTPGRNTAPVRGVDVASTLLGLAGIPQPEGMTGHDLIRETVAADRPRVVETYGGAVVNLPGVKDAMADSGPSHQSALLGDWKLILEGDEVELFDLATDPGELDNRAESDSDRVAEMRAIIQAWIDAAPIGAATENLDKVDLKALESLGYLE